MPFTFKFGRGQRREQYESVPLKDSDDFEDTQNNAESNTEQSKPRRDITLWAVVICVLCTIINVFTYKFTTYEEPITQKTLGRLRRPNQFMGLELLDRPSPPVPQQFMTYPLLLQLVNKAEPKRIYSDDPKRFETWNDTVPPEDKPVMLTSKMSTIVQFRAIDFGMEDCELTLTMPTEQEWEDNTLSSLILGNGTNRIDIWKLNVEYPLEPKKLSWKSRPSRGEKADTIEVIPGQNYGYHFHCPSDSLQVFELSASTEDCHVEWVQDRKNPLPAIALKQHSTW